MADNVPITAGSGTNIATDEVSGTLEHVQIVKLAIAADGSRTAIPADGTDGMLVNLGTNNDVSVTGTVTANLAAGTNNIGDVDVLTLPAIPAGTNNIGDVDVLTINGVAPAFGSGVRGATVQRVTIATDDSVPVTGGVAHDGADSGNPLKVGYKAVSHGANPTAVAAADRTDAYANRHGIPFMLGGHPNIITRSVRVTTSQTDATLVGTINAGTKVVVTQINVMCSGANSVDTNVKIGFGATTIPADSTTGANGVLFDHEGIKAGSGVVIGSGAGILGIGADGEELRLTSSEPTSGALTVSFSYFTIES